MAFQFSRNITGGVPYDDAALQLFLLRQPSNNLNFYPQEQADCLPPPSSTPYRPLEHDYTRVCAQTFSDDPSLQPLAELGTAQQKALQDFALILEELKQGISSIQAKCDNLESMALSILTKCDNLQATISNHEDWYYSFHLVHFQISLTGTVE
jgi:hypothetical protein